MWIIYCVMIIWSAEFTKAEDIYTLISAADAEGTPFISVLHGDPEVWSELLKSGGTVSAQKLTGNPNTTSFRKLGFHYAKGKVIFSDGKDGNVETFPLLDAMASSAGFQQVHTYTSVEVGGVVIDWVSNNIYWTDRVYNWIMMSSLDGEVNSYATVIDTALDEPGGIAVNPATSHLFWTDYGSTPKIERSSLHGTERTTIVSSGLTSPMYLNMDHSTNTLYWVDTGRSIIESCNLDGTSRTTFLQSSIVSTLVGFTIHENFIFGMSDSSKTLYTMEIDKPGAYVSSTMDYDHLYDIQIYSSNQQPQYTSQCELSSCTSMCVGANNNSQSQCVCPDGQNLVIGYICSGSAYIEGPRYVYTLSNALCWYPVWTPVLTDEELSHNCLSSLSIPASYYLGHLYAQRYLYLASENSIGRVLMAAGASFDVRIRNVGDIKGFAVDWISENMYWTNSEGIMVATADSQYMRQLMVLTGLNGLTVDPTEGYLYYTRIATSPYIGRAYLSGSSQTTLVSTSLGKPEQPIVDYHEKRLYWTDSLLDRIESIKTDGSDRKVIITISNSHPFGLAIFQDHIMWTDQTSSEPGLHWAYKDGTGETIRSVLKTVTTGDIVLFGDYSQPDAHTNKTAVDKGGCAHIYLPTPGGSICQCGTGYKVDSDGKSCKPDTSSSEAALIFIDTVQGEIFQMDITTYKLTAIPVSSLANPVALDIDPEDGLLFWTDVGDKTIRRSTLMGGNQVTIKQLSSDAVPDGLAVDSEEKLIFYTDTGNNVIVRMDYNGGSEKTLVTTVDEPRAMVLDFAARYMYWTDWGINPKIERATYDGLYKQTIVSNTNMGWPNGLTLDKGEQVLYWCDGMLGRIESINTDGTNRNLLFVEEGERFFGIIFFNEYLYLTSWSSGYIQRIHKDGGDLSDIGNRLLIRTYGITAYKSISPTTTASTTSATPTTTTTQTTTTPTTTTTQTTTTTTTTQKTTTASTTSTTSSTISTTPSTSTSFNMIGSSTKSDTSLTTMTEISPTANTANRGADPGVSEKTNGLSSTLIIIIAIVSATIIAITGTLTLGIYCCFKRKRNTTSGNQTSNFPNLDPTPPPYTFPNEAFKDDMNNRPISSVYATIPENPYESSQPSASEDQPTYVGSGYSRLRDITQPPENPNRSEVHLVDNSAYISLYQPKGERSSDVVVSADDYMTPSSFISGEKPKVDK